MEATVTGRGVPRLLLASLLATCSFLAETGVLGAEGIFSIKSRGSLIAGLTIPHFSLPDILSGSIARSWREEARRR